MRYPAMYIGIAFILLAGMLQACGPSNAQTLSIAPPACTEIGQTWTAPSDGMTLVCVPDGDFLMGAIETDIQAQPDEKPQRKIYLDAFWMDRTEVTNAMFAKCTSAGACHPRTHSPYLWGVASRTRDSYFGNPIYDAYPVIMLDANEAETYCRWVGRRLPSEAEWEKTARRTDGRTYPWGEGLDCQKANYAGCVNDTSETTAHPPGASPYGALDLLGNVWEWTADWYAPNAYESTVTKNPTGPTTGEFRVMRGGAWGSFVEALRITNRANGKPEHDVDGEVGFRCAMSALSTK